MVRQIAERGMGVIMRVIDQYSRDADFLSLCFRLLGHLAFVESNLKIIVQHNGIQVCGRSRWCQGVLSRCDGRLLDLLPLLQAVMKAISDHPDSKLLMVRCIQTIDNIAMANQEHAALVIEVGIRLTRI